MSSGTPKSCGDSAFSTGLCTSGRSSGYWLKFRWSSKTTARKALCRSYQDVSFAPLHQGEYGSVEWYGKRSPFATRQRTLFLKWWGPSKISRDGSSNAVCSRPIYNSPSSMFGRCDMTGKKLTVAWVNVVKHNTMPCPWVCFRSLHVVELQEVVYCSSVKRKTIRASYPLISNFWKKADKRLSKSINISSMCTPNKMLSYDIGISRRSKMSILFSVCDDTKE